MSCHLESKLSGAFNFIKKIALRIAHYRSLIYRNQRREFIMKILNSIFLCSVFNSLERIYIESEHMDLS